MSCLHPTDQRLTHHSFNDGLVLGSCATCGQVLTWSNNIQSTPTNSFTLIDDIKDAPNNKPWQFNPNNLKWEPRKPTEKGPWQFCVKCDSPDYIEIITRIRDGHSYKTMIDNRKYWITRGGIGRR